MNIGDALEEEIGIGVRVEKFEDHDDDKTIKYQVKPSSSDHSLLRRIQNRLENIRKSGLDVGSETLEVELLRGPNGRIRQELGGIPVFVHLNLDDDIYGIR